MLYRKYKELIDKISGHGKQYKYLWKRMLDKSLILRAYKKLRKGKTKRAEIKEIDANLDEEIDKMRVMIENTRPGGDESLAFHPKKHRARKLWEHGKWRIVYMPEIHEQWLHHIIILVLEPIITATAYKFTCGSFPGRGAHRAKNQLKKWICKRKGIRYFVKIDIRHFYGSIRKMVLFRELRIRIKDEWFLFVLDRCLSGFPKGLPLGFYISQWLANYLLEPLDRFISGRVEVYIRYMDDIVFMGDNKKKLHKLLREVMQLLGRMFRLRLKDNWQVVKFDYKGKGRPIDFMGFVFYRNRIAIRKSIMLAAVRMATKLARDKIRGKYYKRHLSAMVSYMGWFKHTDSYDCYLIHIKPKVDIGKCKRIISKLDRRANRERMERGTLLRAA